MSRLFFKECSYCNGSGYYQIDLDGFPLDVLCGECNGSGESEGDFVILVVSIYTKPLKRVILSLTKTPNRPNNPDIYEMVEVWVRYNYGDVNYDYAEITENEINIIDESWNIENYR